MFKTILRENSKNSAAKKFRIDTFLNLIFQDDINCQILPESWFAYPQNPHKKLNTMAQFFFLHRCAEERGVFKLRVHIPQNRKI